jgi:hypothetical protein
VKEFLSKCVALDVVPVLIARRIQHSTFVVLNPCGVILHQTYNQLFPTADELLANQAKEKTNLGFHDIRVGNAPDDRLIAFVSKHLPKLLPAYREKFKEYKDLTEDFANNRMDYPEFAARVIRRSKGLNEEGGMPDDFWPDLDINDEDDE